MSERLKIFRNIAQISLEFAFSFVLLLLLFYGCIMVIRWAGLSLAERRAVHEQTMTQEVERDWRFYADSPLRQLRGDFYKSPGMNLLFLGN